ncbi:CRISPR-associated endonuclease Cas1, partial [Myxococcota bacterium]|nr:CRISPR-associated endonuclease Cas1 [Myxococcota bacterium]
MVAIDPPQLMPARMLTQFVFCNRLGYLEWVQGEFAHNYYTISGKLAHLRVDEKESAYEPPSDEENPDDQEDSKKPKIIRSMSLTSETLGLTAKLDVCELSGNIAVPVEYRRARAPKRGPFLSDKVQVCVQALLLREAGYQCTEGALYYVGSKKRVPLPVERELIDTTLEALKRFRGMAKSGICPPPLEDESRCEFCSLVGLCLPDEVNMLKTPWGTDETTSRRLLPVRPDVVPLCIQEQGSKLTLRGDELIVQKDRYTLARFRILEMAHIVLMGNVQVSAQAEKRLMRENIPIIRLSTGGWFYGITLSGLHNNIDIRQAQFRLQSDPGFCLTMARRTVSEKIRNCRTLLRRNALNLSQDVLPSLKESYIQAEAADSLPSLLGIEGMAAKIYFGSFSKMIKSEPWSDLFSFTTRNRRPPKDPVNAMLSLAYSMLTKECLVAVLSSGLDPHFGYYHQPRYARPALALDIMEGFRPLVADSVVLRLINNGQLQPQ